MPQGKIKVKVRLPPRTSAKEKSRDKLRHTRKAAPSVPKVQSLGQKLFKEGEKALRDKIEKEMRSRAITSEPKTTFTTTNVKSGSALHSGTSGGSTNSTSKPSVKQVLRKIT